MNMGFLRFCHAFGPLGFLASKNKEIAQTKAKATIARNNVFDLTSRIRMLSANITMPNTTFFHTKARIAASVVMVFPNVALLFKTFQLSVVLIPAERTIGNWTR